MLTSADQADRIYLYSNLEPQRYACGNDSGISQYVLDFCVYIFIVNLQIQLERHKPKVLQPSLSEADLLGLRVLVQESHQPILCQQP